MKQIFLIVFFLLFSLSFSAQEFTIDKLNEFNIGQSYISELTMEIEDNYLYLMSTYGLEIFEILSDGTLELKSRLGLTYTSRFRKAGDYVYIATLKSGFDPFPHKLYQIDVSDVDNPNIINVIESNYDINTIEIYGDYLYMLEIGYDYIDSFYSIPDMTLEIQYQNSYHSSKKVSDTIAINPIETNIFDVIDFSDPISPDTIGSADLTNYHDSGIHKATLYQQNILMCSNNSKITFWDVGDWKNN